MKSRSATPPLGPPIIDEPEAAHRLLLLGQLQAALKIRHVRSVLARNHRLVLRYNTSPCPPSGLTDPQLHIFAPNRTDITTTDGIAYLLASGSCYPAANPDEAAEAIARNNGTATASPDPRAHNIQP